MVLGGGNKPLRLLNTFLEECDVKTIIKPQIEWNDCVDRTKRRYIQHTRDIIVAVLKVVSPENAGYLWTALQASKAVNDELGVEGILLPAQRVYLEAIAETYKNASSWDTRRQILSIMTGTASLAAIREFIPGLTQFRYTVANLHRLQHGTGASVPRHATARFRVDEAQLYHFSQFITSSHIVQDLHAFWPEESTTLKWQRSGRAKCYPSSYTGVNNYPVQTVQRSRLHSIQPKNNASDTFCM